MSYLSGTALQYARIVGKLRADLKAEYAVEDGDEALETTLEGATDLPELLAAMARKVVLNVQQAHGIDELAKSYMDRSQRLENEADRLRAAITWALQEAGMKRIPADVLPEMTASLSVGRAPLVIHNEAEVPDEFMRVKMTSEPNKVMIRERLEAGERSAWASLGNAKPMLTLRTK